MNWLGCRMRRPWPVSVPLRRVLNGLRNTTQILFRIVGTRIEIWTVNLPSTNGGAIHSNTTQYSRLQYSLICNLLLLSFLFWPLLPTNCTSMCRGLLLHLITHTHTHTHTHTKSVGLPLTKDQPAAQRTTFTTDKYPSPCNPSKRSAPGLRLTVRPPGSVTLILTAENWDTHSANIIVNRLQDCKFPSRHLLIIYLFVNATKGRQKEVLIKQKVHCNKEERN
jgi:hypothetical protein